MSDENSPIEQELARKRRGRCWLSHFFGPDLPAFGGQIERQKLPRRLPEPCCVCARYGKDTEFILTFRVLLVIQPKSSHFIRPSRSPSKTMQASPQRPVITICTHALQPSSSPDIPPAALSDASSPPWTTEPDSASPQASLCNSPDFDSHVGLATTEDSSNKPRKSPVTTTHKTTDASPEWPLALSRSCQPNDVRGSAASTSPSESSTSPSSSIPTLSTPTSPAPPTPTAHVARNTPYLHPHAQSYAALAAATASRASQPFTRWLPGDDTPADQKKRENPSSSSADKSPTAPKRRKTWVHALEKSLFTPEEIVSLSAPVRRSIYTASLEAHVDKLHNQLLEMGLFPVPFEKLEPYRGLNSKTAKVGVICSVLGT
jgi:hypothetical protein